MEEDRQRRRQKPELKIVKEETVHRLRIGTDSAGVPRKKANLRRSNEEAALLRDLTSGDVSPPTPAEDPAKSQPLAPAEPIRIPPALFILAGGGFLLLLALGIFLSLGGRNRDRLQRSQEAARESLRSAKQEQAEAREIVNSLTEALLKYSSAETIEEKLAVVRDRERVEPLMRDYYSKHKLEPVSGISLTSQYTLPIESRSFVVLTGSLPNGLEKVFLAEVDNEQKVSIDWESDVCFQPVEIKDFIESRDTTPTDLRVFAKPDNFYVYEFADSEKYQCLKLTFRDSDEYLFGYIERDSKDAARLFNQFKAARSNGSNRPEPLLITVRYMEDGKSERGVLIEKYIAPRWAFIDEFTDEER